MNGSVEDINYLEKQESISSDKCKPINRCAYFEKMFNENFSSLDEQEINLSLQQKLSVSAQKEEVREKRFPAQKSFFSIFRNRYKIINILSFLEFHEILESSFINQLISKELKPKISNHLKYHLGSFLNNYEEDFNQRQKKIEEMIENMKSRKVGKSYIRPKYSMEDFSDGNLYEGYYILEEVKRTDEEFQLTKNSASLYGYLIGKKIMNIHSKYDCFGFKFEKSFLNPFVPLTEMKLSVLDCVITMLPELRALSINCELLSSGGFLILQNIVPRIKKLNLSKVRLENADDLNAFVTMFSGAELLKLSLCDSNLESELVLETLKGRYNELNGISKLVISNCQADINKIIEFASKLMITDLSLCDMLGINDKIDAKAFKDFCKKTSISKLYLSLPENCINQVYFAQKLSEIKKLELLETKSNISTKMRVERFLQIPEDMTLFNVNSYSRLSRMKRSWENHCWVNAFKKR